MEAGVQSPPVLRQQSEDLAGILGKLEDRMESPTRQATPLGPLPQQSQPDLEKTRKELSDPRTISRAHDPEGRQERAEYIGAIRRLRDKRNEEISAKQEHVESLGAELRRLLDTFPSKVRRRLNMHDAKLEQINTQIGQLEEEIIASERLKSDLPNTRELLDAYYERAATMPLTIEEKRRLLQTEVLSSLTTEEYIALWRRLNPYFLSHVTRQGFRDHNAMIYHSSGLDEFHSGFRAIAADDKMLRPPLAINGLIRRDEETVRAYISDWELEAESEEMAKKRWSDNLNHTWATAPKYPDKTAVHLATQIVADGLYGGETGNEVFIAFPSDVIASQYDFAFNGAQKDFTRPQSDVTWNDVFVWLPNLDYPGIPIDSGVVFLPKNIPVDPETGSKYASEVKVIDGEERRVMMKDVELEARFFTWIKSSEGADFLKRLFDQYLQMPTAFNVDRAEAERVYFESISEKLAALGFAPDTFAGLSRQLMVNLHWRDEWEDSNLEEILTNTRSTFKRPGKTTSAKEYWESYFTAHPEQRPKHVVYYDGDPTTAVYAFQQRNNIGKADTSETEGKLLGFDDHFVKDMRTDERANRGYDELYDLGVKIIEDKYRRE